MSIVLHKHLHAKHDAMSKQQQQQHNVQPVVVKKGAVLPVHGIALPQTRRRTARPPHGDDEQRVVHEQLCHVELRRQAPTLQKSTQVENVQHEVVHARDLRRARRHVGRERWREAGRGRGAEQRQRRRGEAGRRDEERPRGARFVTLRTKSVREKKCSEQNSQPDPTEFP